MRKALDQVASGVIKAQKPGVCKYSFLRISQAIPVTFKTYDSLMMELVEQVQRLLERLLPLKTIFF